MYGFNKPSLLMLAVNVRVKLQKQDPRVHSPATITETAVTTCRHTLLSACVVSEAFVGMLLLMS
jgi:hypothetical protein